MKRSISTLTLTSTSTSTLTLTSTSTLTLVLALSLTCCAAAFCIVGCRRTPPRPEGLPELYPCEICATFDGKTIEGVQVALIPETSVSKKWRAGGATDEKGVAKMRTSFCYEGVPAGSYRLSFSKLQERWGDELDEMTPLSSIPLKYGPEASEISVEIKSEKNRFSFDLDGGEELVPVPKGTRPAPKMKR